MPSGKATHPAAVQATPAMLLDSFQRSARATLPIAAAAKQLSGNRLRIRRDRDSVTVSGVVFAEGENKAKGTWHFYFRASGKNCYAYMKQDFITRQAGIKELAMATSEVGYCLHFFKTAS